MLDVIDSSIAVQTLVEGGDHRRLLLLFRPVLRRWLDPAHQFGGGGSHVCIAYLVMQNSLSLRAVSNWGMTLQ